MLKFEYRTVTIGIFIMRFHEPYLVGINITNDFGSGSSLHGLCVSYNIYEIAAADDDDDDGTKKRARVKNA